MKLVIAEKPVLARDIARAICGKEVGESARLPIEGNGYVVCACAGHLIELKDPEEIKEAWGKPWKVDVLPIWCEPWEQKVSQDKKELVGTIARLLKSATSVIHAGDPDDEGQLIVDEVLDFLGYDGDVYRVYVNDNIEKNIRKAFENLVDNRECRGVGEAAFARSVADYCFGINESRLASCRLRRPLSVGRVQTPTLGLVVARDEAISRHAARHFYELYMQTGITDQGSYLFKFKPHQDILEEGDKHIFDKKTLEEIASRHQGQRQHVTTEVKEEKEAPPLPYNLTKLQSHMSKLYKFSAKKTQELTQVLRDKHKAITYNRTDSEYLKEEHFAEAANVLQSGILASLGIEWPLDFSLKSKAFNDANVTAHHAIIPQETMVDVSGMTEDELKVYSAIVKRYALQFLPPKLSDVSTSSYVVSEGVFTHKVSVIKDHGWSEYVKSNKSDEDEEDLQEGWIDAGQYEGLCAEAHIAQKETSPPKPYTEGTLIADMASIAKYVSDERLREVLKRKDDGKKGESGGIGTTATRGDIIEKLKVKKFIVEEKGKILSTELGREFYKMLPKEIRGADVTALWWLLQEEVSKGKLDPYAIQKSVIEVFCAHKDTAYLDGGLSRSGLRIVGSCPLCKKNVVDKGKMYVCEDNTSKKDEASGTWKRTGICDFRMWTTAFDKKLTALQLSQLLQNGQTKSVVKGLKRKDGTVFEAKLELNKQSGTYRPVRKERK